jgi:hypothetical protein
MKQAGRGFNPPSNCEPMVGPAHSLKGNAKTYGLRCSCKSTLLALFSLVVSAEWTRFTP